MNKIDELKKMKNYLRLIETNGVCIKHNAGCFYQNPQDEQAKQLLIKAYKAEIEKKERELDREL